MIGSNQDEYEQISQIVEETIGFFINNYDVQQVNLPLIKNTYTLWRKQSFNSISKLSSYVTNRQNSIYSFYFLSQCKYLKQYIHKIQNLSNNCSPSIEGKDLNTISRLQVDLLDQYNLVLWKHTIYCELFEDLIKIPYLEHIFPSSKRYRLKSAFSQIMPFQDNNKSTEIMEKVSEGVIKKGFGQLADKMFTKTFLLRASSVAIRLNPVAIAASFAFSQLIDYYRKQKKQQELITKLKQLVSICKKNVQVLVRTYEQSIELLAGAIKGQDKLIEQFLNRVSEVIEIDWLEVTKFQDQDGWDIIVLEGQLGVEIGQTGRN